MEFFEFKYFNSIFFAGIGYLFWNCECKKADELIVENRTEIDRSEAERYEFTHESCIFYIFFSNLIVECVAMFEHQS